MLGDLYHATGDWRAYENQMETTVARHQQSAAVREAYARKLLARGDPQSIDRAIIHVLRLKELAPNSAAMFELTVRLANKRGKQEAARNELLRRQPKIDDKTEVTRPLELAVRLFGGLFVELNDLDSAEKLYKALAARDPSKSYSFAMFLGQHRSVDQCFEQLNQIYQPDRIADILGVALSVVREKRDQVGDKYDATIQGWLDRGLLDNPDSITLLMLQADLFDIQKRYSDAAAIYRKLLDRSELTGTRRAVVLNNLSFLASLEGSAASNVDPLKLANEAAEHPRPKFGYSRYPRRCLYGQGAVLTSHRRSPRCGHRQPHSDQILPPGGGLSRKRGKEVGSRHLDKSRGAGLEPRNPQSHGT